MKKCPICKKEIKPPETYWKSMRACSACIRKMILEIQTEEEYCPECNSNTSIHRNSCVKCE